MKHQLFYFLSFLYISKTKSNRSGTMRFYRLMVWRFYAPMYISDYCSNHCPYCGFNTAMDFKRTRLSLEEIEQEAKMIADSGIRHILVLTGEVPAKTVCLVTEIIGAQNIEKRIKEIKLRLGEVK